MAPAPAAAARLRADALDAREHLPDGQAGDVALSRVLVCCFADARGRFPGALDWGDRDGLPDRLDAAWAAVEDRVPTDPLPLDAWPDAAALADAVAALRTVGDTDEPRDFAAIDPRHVGTVHEAVLADRRKAAGAYYTPLPVVAYVVAETVGPLAEAVAAGERDLTDLAVLDPAMGCGRFLVGAVCELRDRLAGESGDDPQTLVDDLVANTVYGVDLDARAVDLAVLVCWLATDAGPAALASLRQHLAVGDSLVGAGPDGASTEPSADSRPPADSQPLDWPATFPDVLGPDGATGERGRFDAAIGNPPYVRSRHLPADLKTYLREHYSTVTGAFDLYIPFVERSGDLAAHVGLVVPNKWTTTRYGRPLRDQLLDRHRLTELVDLSSHDVFPDANVYPLVLRFAADAGPTETVTVARPAAEATITAAERVAVPRAVVDRLGDRVVPTDLSADAADLVARLSGAGDRLGDHATMTEGIHTGNVRERLLVDDPGPDTEPVVGGDAVTPYLVDWAGRYIRYDPGLVDEAAGEYADLREPALFEGEKLLVPDVSEGPEAGYDDHDRYVLNSCYVVRPRDGSPYSTWALLGLLNAGLVDWYFRQVYGGSHVSGGYLRCKPMFLGEVPLPAAPPPDAVDRLAALARQAHDARRARRDLEPALALSVDGALAGDDTDTLADLGAVAVATGPLGATTRTHDRLRIGRVAVEQTDEGVVILATARYRPDEQDPATDLAPDSWGYVETDLRPAVRLACDDRLGALVGAVVSQAVAGEGSPAGFRREASKTNSLTDRLLAVRVPDPAAVADELDSYRETTQEAAELAATIRETDARIDEVVASLFGLSVEESEIVARAAEED
ncbi:Eco57I restriction-modification methylase domain-containing protein [Haloarchaeobius amylolyticus]|uniref:Eco57I restriction-modification methylase domain-containing protein n=1 Tax=Haloarchaeobius amylolyticus TaxID=1198296 RepID=UPI00226F46D5|nr:TaqI-like C-terminal specificity domain-containing protein [Haloarchaeobius amylolyticus]